MEQNTAWTVVKGSPNYIGECDTNPITEKQIGMIRLIQDELRIYRNIDPNTLSSKDAYEIIAVHYKKARELFIEKERQKMTKQMVMWDYGI